MITVMKISFPFFFSLVVNRSRDQFDRMRSFHGTHELARRTRILFSEPRQSREGATRRTYARKQGREKEPARPAGSYAH